MITIAKPLSNGASVIAIALLGIVATATGAQGQDSIEIDSVGFTGVLHGNLSNSARQGSGFTPLALKPHPGANLFRDDAVGLNFEHIFNGAREEHEISMFTPRKDTCRLAALGGSRYRIEWPSDESQWGMKSHMVYDLAVPGQVDLQFECTPTQNLFPQGFVAMMWASYMNRTLDRRIHFWGADEDRHGWIAFGEDTEQNFEVGTVSHLGMEDLPYEKGSQTLNLIEHSTKKFITPFYYGLIDGDHDLKTTDDRLLYLMLFDQTAPIRFAMWNFIKTQDGNPDTHSPAWDWQYVIRDPKIGKTYGYRARVIVQPFRDENQIWQEYRRWSEDLDLDLPQVAGK